MRKPTKATKARAPKESSCESKGATGSYRYDGKTGRVVKVSDRVPSRKSRGGLEDLGFSGDVGPCGRTQCGGGSCGGPFGGME